MKITPQELSVLSQNYTDKEIGESLGVHGRTVCMWRKTNNIPASHIRKNRLYTLDHTFFKQINTPEKAYLLGFVSADGSIHKDGKTVSIALCDIDALHLGTIKKNLMSNAPIHIKKSSRWGSGDMSVVNICSKKLIKDLSNLGITNNKSKTMLYPNIPNQLDRHFIRGVFDGDGWIGERQFALISSNLPFLETLNEKLFFHLNQKLHINKAKNKNNCVYYRMIGGKKTSFFLQWLYNSQTISLPRKYTSYKKYWS